MINQTVITGWIAYPVEVKTTRDGVKYIRNAMRSQRNYKGSDGYPVTDTINFTAWSHTAEYLEKYANKNDRIVIRGRLESSSYTIKEAVRENGELAAKDRKIYSVQIRAEDIDLVRRSDAAKEQHQARHASSEQTSVGTAASAPENMTQQNETADQSSNEAVPSDEPPTRPTVSAQKPAKPFPENPADRVHGETYVDSNGELFVYDDELPF